MADSKEQITKVTWNFGVDQLKCIANLMQQGGYNLVNNKPLRMFYCYRAIKIMISGRLTDEELVELKGIETEIFALNKDFQAPINWEQKKEYDVNNNKRLFQIEKLAEHYAIKIMKLLRKYDYDVGDKEDRTMLF